MFKFVAALSGVAFLSACASQPEDIQATYVSPNLYANYTCSELLEERERIVARVSSASAAQSDKATNDAVATGVGLILFWPAIFFLASGTDREAELASLKGNYDAIDQATIKRKCSLPSPSGAPAQVANAPATAASASAIDNSFEAQQRSIEGQSATTVAPAAPSAVEPQPVVVAVAPAAPKPTVVAPAPTKPSEQPPAEPVVLASKPTPVAAAAASPSIPAALYDDPNLAAPVEYSRAEIQGYCGQAWRIRDLTDGTFEINPCYDRRYN